MSAMIQLGLRAMACKHWRWMPGMLSTTGVRILGISSEKITAEDIPDFRDPATVGCLLALVREAWEDETMCCESPSIKDGCWTVACTLGVVLDAPTEAEALVAALEAAA